jgi:hypothetical protein
MADTYFLLFAFLNFLVFYNKDIISYAIKQLNFSEIENEERETMAKALFEVNCLKTTELPSTYVCLLFSFGLPFSSFSFLPSYPPLDVSFFLSFYFLSLPLSFSLSLNYLLDLLEVT